jgi:hypothetical protein
VWTSLAFESEKACSRADICSLLIVEIGGSSRFEIEGKSEEGPSAGK